MTGFAARSRASDAARIAFMGALMLFVITIVIGILNGMDVWEPEHDVLMGHVHSGTLGWITLGVSGIGLLMFTRDRELLPGEAARTRTLALAMVAAITLYVAAFIAGDSLFDDRIQRPIAGTLLFMVVIWFFTWLMSANRAYATKSPARLGFILAWISLMIGAIFGIILGLYTANGQVPGLSDDTAAAVAEAHPPAMLIGYLLLAAFAGIEWLLHADKPWSRAASIQMWLLFLAGVIFNIAFVTGTDDALAGPANLLMIVAAVMLLWRSRAELAPAGWRRAGEGVFPRVAAIALVGALALLTILIYWFVTDQIDFDALTESQEGLGLSFDHTLFIGVMTNVLFGALATNLRTRRTTSVNRVLLWGVNVGIVGFAIGLITVTAALKQVFAPIMGLSLLIGIGVYLMELRTSTRSQPMMS